MSHRYRGARGGLVAAGLLVLWSCAGAAQAPSDLVAVSPFEDAAYSDLVIEPSGQIHALWQSEPDAAFFPDLFYSTSRDGGRSWSAALQIAEGTSDAPLGIPYLLLDGNGRIYALWKVLVDGMTGMDMEEMPAAPVYGTIYYRVLEDGQWSATGQIGPSRSVLSWFPSAGPGGLVSVIWSESPEPVHIMTTNEDAGVIRATVISGATVGQANVVLNSAGTGGYWGITGYVDTQGEVHGYALKGRDAPTFVRFDGSQVAAQGNIGMTIRNYGMQRLPTLVLDPTGGEHLLLYNGDATNPAILDYAGADEPLVVVRAPGGQIRDFQVTRGPDGALVVTAAVRQGDGGITADLYVSEWSGGQWGAPRNVTHNESRSEASGVGTSTGITVGSSSAWTALRGAAVQDANGRTGVLVTNQMTGGAGINQRSVGSREYVSFTWLAEDTGRPTPPPTPPASRPEPARPAPQPSPPPARPPESLSPPPDPAGLPTGSYPCRYISPYVGDLPTQWSIGILSGGQYRGLAGDIGTYVFQSGAINWTSGSLARDQTPTEFYRGDDGRPTIKVVLPGAESDPSKTLYCVL